MDEENAEDDQAPKQNGPAARSSVTSLGSAQKQKKPIVEGGFVNEAYTGDISDESDEESGQGDKKKGKEPGAEGDKRKGSIKPGSKAEGSEVGKKGPPTEKQMEEGTHPVPRARQKKKPEIVLDWWSKYYASMQAEEVRRLNYKISVRQASYDFFYRRSPNRRSKISARKHSKNSRKRLEKRRKWWRRRR